MFKREDKKNGGDVIGFIGKSMALEGKLSFDDTVRIDGRFKGEITSNGTLVIADNGSVEGQIKVGSAIITGELRGTLEASARVELRSPAKIYGDIKTPNLIIGEGVVFEGNCIMSKKDHAASALPESVAYSEGTNSQLH